MIDFSQNIFALTLAELREIKEILKEIQTAQSTLLAIDHGRAHTVPANGTPEGCAVSGGELTHNLSPFVETSLAYVVGILHNSWLDGPAKTWGAVRSVRPLAVTSLDKRVSSTIREGFACFSQLILNLKQLLLESRELGVVSEERILGLEKLVGNSGALYSDEIPVTDGKRASSHIPSGLNGRDGNGD